MHPAERAGRPAAGTDAAAEPLGADAPVGAASPPGLDWAAVDTVLLDLDGTLLDLAFDNHFWLERIPAAFAAAHGLSVADARAALVSRFRACEGTLAWYCIEHWSRELGLDVAALKRECAARIAWLPGARDFLQRVRAAGKRLVLLTNAHPVALAIKDERTGVARFMDAMLSSHRVGAPKEDARFWHAARQLARFDARRSLFVDDSPAVLRAAAGSGIRFLCGIRCPDSRGARRDHPHIPAVDGIAELLRLPGLAAAATEDARAADSAS
jgi:HAD superfamily hydrolase (TIGR01509 family)